MVIVLLLYILALNNPTYDCSVADKGALNNPIYDDKFDRRKNTCSSTNDQSDPLYSSKNYMEDSRAAMEQSVFAENQFLVNILQSKRGDVTPTASPPLEEGIVGIEQDHNDVPRMDPYSSYKDEYLAELAHTGQQRTFQ